MLAEEMAGRLATGVRVRVAPRLLLVGLLLGCLCACDASTASAQTEIPAAPAAASPSPPAKKGGLADIPPEVQFLPNKQGELVPIPVDSTFEEFLEFVRKRWQPKAPTLPPGIVSAVQLEGTSDEQRVLLTARITIEINAEGPVSVPLSMAEAVQVAAATHRGPGRSAFAPTDRERGLVWWLEGIGTHELELKLAVPLTKNGNWRRLALGLPAAPVSTLKLLIPETIAPRTIVPEQTVLESRAVDGRWELQASGWNGRLDLSWMPTQPEVDRSASLEANATILVRGSSDQFSLDVTQVVRALQGSFREFTVRLPKGAKVLQLYGAEVKEYRSDPQKAELVTVVLNGPQTGQVTVRWSISLPANESLRQTIEGMDVQGARRQAGEIGLIPAEGLVWNVTDPSDPIMLRLNAGELRTTPGTGMVARAYRFLAQPFSLPISLEPVKPYLDVEPLILLKAGEDELQLTLEARIRTFRGRVAEVLVHWPNWKADEWIPEAAESQGELVTSVTEDPSTPGLIRLALRSDAPESFRLTLRARRSGRTTEPLNLSLPTIEADSSQATRLVLVNDLNVESEITARGETVLRRSFAESSVDWSERGYSSPPRFQEYRIDTDERNVTLNVAVKERLLSVTSDVDSQIAGERLRLKQRLRCRVDYGALSELSLLVPARLMQTISFRFQGKLLEPVWTESAAERRAVIGLPKPQTGEFDVIAEWTQPWSLSATARETTLQIPLLQLEKADVHGASLSFPELAWLDVATATPAWTQTPSSSSRLLWETKDSTSGCSLTITTAAGPPPGDFLAHRAVIRVVHDEQGRRQCRAQVRLTGAADVFHVRLPEGAGGGESAAQFRWDRQLISGERVMELPPGSGRYSLELPENAAGTGDHLLVIDYAMPKTNQPGWYDATTLPPPELPQAKWVAQILWVVGLPATQHLFGPPVNAAPLFRWERTGWMWRRVALLDDAQIDRWMNAQEAPIDAWLPAAGNIYLLSQFGPPQTVRLSSLSTPAALLFGSGSALLIGFLLLKLSWFRWLPVLIGLGCGLVLAALSWRAEAELLLQPALLGAVFPAMAFAAELWQQRRAFQAILTLNPPGELSLPSVGSGYREGSQLDLGGAEPATVLRMPPLTGGDSTAQRVPAESSVR